MIYWSTNLYKQYMYYSMDRMILGVDSGESIYLKLFKTDEVRKAEWGKDERFPHYFLNKIVNKYI